MQLLAAPIYLVAALVLAGAVTTPARADFFDDVRRTFQTDIPHFFQDDIPCAFGGQPTSHTKTSCHGAAQPATPAADRRASPPHPAPAQPQAVTREPREYP
jgi:hypothetical protein